MTVLFSGSSSFTGYHFLKEMNKKKIKTIAIFSKKKSFYRDTKSKEIIDSKLKFIEPCVNTLFGSKKYIKKIKEYKIDTICFHHFNVGNLNYKHNFQRNLKQTIHNLENVVSHLSLNKKPKIIYTSSVYQKISNKNEYLNDNSRIQYGLSKLTVNNVLKYLCGKYKIKFINIELKNPIGIFEKKKSLPYYLANNYFQKNQINLDNPKRIFKYSLISEISKNYVKSIEINKCVKSKYININVFQFMNLLFRKFELVKNKKIKNKFWVEYYNHYKNIYENN